MAQQNSQPIKLGVIFPGQGSQYKGIGRDIYTSMPEIKRIYEEASDAINIDMARLSFDDPNDEINLTKNTQPVLVTHHFACLRALETRLGDKMVPLVAAGHSLGEYTALVAAGKLCFADAVKAVRRRGELMSELGTGEMVAFGLTEEDITPVAAEFNCSVAVCNLPDQTVVGGASDDLDKLCAKVEEVFPKKRFARLKTEGAFHTPYMQQAADEFKNILTDLEIREGNGVTKVLSNYTGSIHDNDADGIRERLYLQLRYPVQWVKNLAEVAKDQPARVIEFGGGLGEGDDPADKRANLEGIIKKSWRRVENAPQYSKVINEATLDETLALLSQ